MLRVLKAGGRLIHISEFSRRDGAEKFGVAEIHEHFESKDAWEAALKEAGFEPYGIEWRKPSAARQFVTA